MGILACIVGALWCVGRGLEVYVGRYMGKDVGLYSTELMGIH